MYLTPDRFKTLGLGVDLEGVEDVDIRSAITRASAQIDAVCAVPRLPQKYDFRGGRMVDEAHAWYIDPYERPHPFQFWPWSTPVIAVEAFAIYSTNDIKVEIDPTNIFVNNSAGYVELSSLNLTQFGIFGAGIVPLLGLYNPVAKMTYTYGHRFPITDEETDPIDGQTYQTQHQFWTDDAVVVKVNGTITAPGAGTQQDPTVYTINRHEGWIVFAANQPANTIVEVSYTFSLPWEISQATGLIVAQDIGEAELQRKGMAGIESIRVASGGGASVEIKRPRFVAERGRTEGSIIDGLPDAAARLLAGFTFVTAR